MSLGGKNIKLRGIVYFSDLFSVAYQISDIPIHFIIQTNNYECSSNPDGELITTTENTQVPDKNDGVVNIHSVLWSEGDNLESSHNFYMNDTDEDGGYNHFELRNYDRAYTLKRDDSSVIFSKGDANPAMMGVREWINGLEL